MFLITWAQDVCVNSIWCRSFRWICKFWILWMKNRENHLLLNSRHARSTAKTHWWKVVFEWMYRRWQLRANNIWRPNQSRENAAVETRYQYVYCIENHVGNQDRPMCIGWPICSRRIRCKLHSCVACVWISHSMDRFILLLFFQWTLFHPH